MKISVRYMDYHWDNYQGGSGKFVEAGLYLELPDDKKISEIHDYAMDKIYQHIEDLRPYKQDNKPTLLSIEVLSF